MLVYRLTHIHDQDEFVEYPTNYLGIYSSSDKVQEAISYYSQLPGFSDKRAKHLYLIEKQNVTVKESPPTVYVAELYLHDKEYWKEFIHLIGYFGTLEEAEKQAKEFSLINESFLSFAKEDAEVIITRYVIDDRYTKSGYSFD